MYRSDNRDKTKNAAIITETMKFIKDSRTFEYEYVLCSGSKLCGSFIDCMYAIHPFAGVYLYKYFICLDINKCLTRIIIAYMYGLLSNVFVCQWTTTFVKFA